MWNVIKKLSIGLVVGGVLVGFLLRGETLTTYQKVGLAFGFIAMLLINLGKPPEEPPVIP